MTTQISHQTLVAAYLAVMNAKNETAANVAQFGNETPESMRLELVVLGRALEELREAVYG